MPDQPASETFTGVVRVDGWDDYCYPGRSTVTWRTWLDGALLGNAIDEAEGHRWIEDMRKMQAASGV